jgi:hypothetical protein
MSDKQKKEINFANFTKKRYDAMRRHVNKYGVDGAKLALDQCVSALEDEQKASKGGRPAVYEPHNLMHIWLYVEEMRARTKLSALAVCTNKKARFDWVSVGPDGPEIKPVTGRTLLRRYQEAKAFLAAESALYADFAQKGMKLKIRGVGFGVGAGTEIEVRAISPTEQHWRKELERRLSQKVVRKLPPKS